MYSSPALFVANFRQCDNFIKNASLRGTTNPTEEEECPVLSCTVPCFPVSQTTKINLLLLNVVVVVVGWYCSVVVDICLEVLSALEFLAQH